jgi:hypothetical protein
MKRKKRNPKADKRAFARTAQKSKAINVKPQIMRGGIRL